MFAKTIMFLAPFSFFAGCDKPTFSSAEVAAAKISADGSTDGSNRLAGDTGYAYGLVVGGGATVLPQAKASAVPSVGFSGASAPLSGTDLANWQSDVYLQAAKGGTFAAVASSTLDLSAASGMVTAQADFKEVQGNRTGSAYASFFVDGEAPHASLLRVSNSAAGDKSQVFWSATDNYRVNQTNSALIGCQTVVTTFTPAKFADLSSLPSGCALVYGGADLFNQPATMTLSALTIASASVLPANVHYGLYVEDMVGLSAFTWITEPAGDQGQLILATQPAAVKYTNQHTGTITLSLQAVDNGKTTQVDDPTNSANWNAYETTISTTGASGSSYTQTFQPTEAVSLAGADGLYTFNVQATEGAGGLASNKKAVLFILDTVAPVISGIQVSVPGGVLSSAATVNLTWNAADTNGIASQTVSIMQTGATTFTQIGTITGGQTSYSFPWGNLPAKGFTIQISATDPAGNTGTGVSAPWTPQIFNAAILTTSVNCFFCHVKVSGDIGGINFSQTPRGDTGTGMTVSGSIYGTNTVPPLLAATASSAANVFSNYTNTPLTIFPKNNQFPQLTSSSLAPRMNGTLKLGTLFINRTYQGNLVLDGSQANQPIVVNGEVYINGDLVIKGKYLGIGTIYANNIYVVNDLVATNSAFPFPDDPTTALAAAQAAVAANKDALYLGALNEVVVGSLEAGLTNDAQTVNLITTNPYSWLPRANYLALGTQAVWPKDVNGNILTQNACCTPDPTAVTDQRTNVEVARVDAYIYAQNVFVWESYNNILLNGGFMAPVSGFLSDEPNWNWSGLNPAPNPRNGLSPMYNVIRYDYRLRSGGAGFETIKSFFDQQ